MADKPVTREEKYLAYLTGDYKGELPKPITRKEKYLYELCLKGIGGEISPEEIKNAVNEYLEKNPVKPGATTEQARQIEQNKTDVASLKTETGSLKEDIVRVTANMAETGIEASDNRFDKDSISVGYIKKDGTIDPSNTNYITTGAIRVQKNDIVKCWDYQDSAHVAEKSMRFICSFDSNGNAIPTAYSSAETTEFTVENGVEYIRVSIYKANIDTIMIILNGDSAPAEYEPYREAVKGNYVASRAFLETSEVIDFFHEIANNTPYVVGKNMVDTSELEVGLIKANANSVWDDQPSYYTTNMIPISAGEAISFTTAKRITVFDTDKTTVIVTADGIKSYAAQQDCLVRISFKRNMVGGFMCNYGESLLPYEPRIQYTRRETVTISDTGDINDFYNTMFAAFLHGNLDVIIKSGEYTITNEFVDALRSYEIRGIPVGGGNRYYFQHGAKIVCNYTGTNTTDVYNFFSPIDTWNVANDFEIYGIDVLAKNCVYAMHDESNGMDNAVKHHYENCKFVLDNTALGTSGTYINKALGGGLGKHETVIIDSCVFESTNLNPSAPTIARDASYHKANNSDFTDANIIMKNSWFKNSFQIDALVGDVPSMFIYTGNSAKANPTQASGWEFKMFGNEIRE